MNAWTMISVTYSRLPKSLGYKADVKVDRVEKVGEEAKVTARKGYLASELPMEDLIRHLHDILNEEPGPHKVTMIRPIPETRWREAGQKGYELSEEEVTIIKNDLPRARKMFAPVEQVCDVRPWVPTLREEN